MPSPFPGMDPYLENPKLWPTFQQQFTTCLYQVLLPGLVDRYRARVGRRTYSTEQPLFTSILREQHAEDYIEIRRHADNKLITLIDMANPTNKLLNQGREQYLEKRKEARAQSANIVEVDLVLEGKPLLEYSRDGLPEWDYAVTLTRAVAPDRFEIYTATLAKRLPRCKIPLAGDDRDVVLDLQSVFARCYDQGNLRSLIDYTKDPPVPLRDGDRKWLTELLIQQKLR